MTKWTIGLCVAFVLLTLISGVIESTFFSSTDAGIFWGLMNPQVPEITNPVTAAFAVFSVAWSYIWSILRILAFDYAFYQGGFVIFRVIFCCLSIGMILSLILSLRGGSTSG